MTDFSSFLYIKPEREYLPFPAILFSPTYWITKKGCDFLSLLLQHLCHVFTNIVKINTFSGAPYQFFLILSPLLFFFFLTNLIAGKSNIPLWLQQLDHSPLYFRTCPCHLWLQHVFHNLIHIDTSLETCIFMFNISGNSIDFSDPNVNLTILLFHILSLCPSCASVI